MICPHGALPQRCAACRLRAVSLFPGLRRKLLAGALAAGVALAATGPLAAQRPYWDVPLDSLALGHTSHTHARVRGVVTLVAHEDDQDLHVRLVSLTGSGRFIVAECIPALPCRLPNGLPWLPAVGDTVTLCGITRLDPEHHWEELHPIEAVCP